MGYFCRTKVPNGVAHTEVVALGKRFTAQDAMERGIVQAAVAKDKIVETSIAMGKSLMKYGDYMRLSVHHMKVDLYKPQLDMLGKFDNALDLPDEYRKYPNSKL